MLAIRTLILVSSLSLALAGTLMEEMTSAGATTAVSFLQSTGLDKDIDSDFLTVFAPSNQAFAELSDEMSKTLSANTSVLQGVLLFHATHGIFRSQDALNNMLIESTLAGSKVRVNVYKDDAGTPLYITLNGAKVLKANIQASNGVLHIIDKVMIPPLGNFYDLVAQSETHKILKQQIDEANLKSTLETYTGTFLAPTDAAFEVLGDVMKSRNMNVTNENARKEILMYHMLGNVVYSAGVSKTTYSTMNHGEKVAVDILPDGSVKVNQASVLLKDVPATNGVLHIIDSVLVPDPYASAIMVG